MCIYPSLSCMCLSDLVYVHVNNPTCAFVVASSSSSSSKAKMASDVEKADTPDVLVVSVGPDPAVVGPPNNVEESCEGSVMAPGSGRHSLTNSIVSCSTTNNTTTTMSRTTRDGEEEGGLDGNTEDDDEEAEDQNTMSNERKGWLMKRSRLSHKWKRKWFLLKNADLFYGSDPQSTSKRISLVNAEISETHMDKKSFAFRIKPRNHRRAFYIHAENELEQNNWMQAICFAKAAGRLGDNSQACVLQ